MTFAKHLRSVSWAASQRLGILRKSWQVFHDRFLLGRCFRCFFLNVLEYFSVVWCSAADTHLKLLDRVVSGASFLTGGLVECDLYKIRCNLIHTLHDALPLSYVPVWATRRGATVAHRYTYAPRCRTSHYHRTFIPLSVSLWNDPWWPVFDGVGVAGYKSGANAFLLA